MEALLSVLTIMNTGFWIYNCFSVKMAIFIMRYLVKRRQCYSIYDRVKCLVAPRKRIKNLYGHTKECYIIGHSHDTAKNWTQIPAELTNLYN